MLQLSQAKAGNQDMAKASSTGCRQLAKQNYEGFPRDIRPYLDCWVSVKG